MECLCVLFYVLRHLCTAVTVSYALSLFWEKKTTMWVKVWLIAQEFMTRLLTSSFSSAGLL